MATHKTCDLCKNEIKEAWFNPLYVVELSITEWHKSDMSIPWTYINAAKGKRIHHDLCANCKDALIKSALRMSNKIRKLNNNETKKD